MSSHEVEDAALELSAVAGAAAVGRPDTEAGEAVVRGIEQRKPRIIVPRRWIALSVLRGITGPMFDKRMEKDAAVQAVLTKMDQREGEEQPTTVSAAAR